MKVADICENLGKGNNIYKPKKEQIGQFFLVTASLEGCSAIVLAEDTTGQYTGTPYNRAFKIISIYKGDNIENHRWILDWHYGLDGHLDITPL